MKKVFETRNFDETKKLGMRIASRILFEQGISLSGKKARVIALYGDLGSGKTTFAQGLAEGLGIKRRIISPTFVIVRTYKIVGGNFYHVDLYRIEKEKEVKDLGIEEIFKDPKNIVAIEWGERMGSHLPKNRIDIKFEYLDDMKRRVEIEQNK